MKEIPPKWILERYSQLWYNKKTEGFTLKEAANILGEKEIVVAVILSKLRKSGWLRVEMNESDYRKKIYYLNNAEEVIEKIGEISA